VDSRRLAAIAALAGALAALYLLLVDTARLEELVAAAVCGVLAATGTHLAGLAGRVRVAVRPAWLARSSRALWWMVRDGFLVSLAALARTPPRGRFRVLPFAAGGQTPRAVGRRVLAKGAGSAGANLYVVGADADAELLLVHELLRRGGRGPLEIVGE
jgi:hypothetical protein